MNFIDFITFLFRFLFLFTFNYEINPNNFVTNELLSSKSPILSTKHFLNLDRDMHATHNTKLIHNVLIWSRYWPIQFCISMSLYSPTSSRIEVGSVFESF